MKRILIVTHLFPYELDLYDKQIERLTTSYQLVEDPRFTIDFKAVLNLSSRFFEWKEATIDPQYFVDRFREVERYLSDGDFGTRFAVTGPTDRYMLGVNDVRRDAINNDSEGYDFFVWSDPDILFSINLLSNVNGALSVIGDDLFVLLQEMLAMPGHHFEPVKAKNVDNEAIRFPAAHIEKVNRGTSYIEKIQPSFNGAFTLFPTKLIREIGIPLGIGNYGKDDLYVQQKLNDRDDVSFYVLRNSVVTQRDYHNQQSSPALQLYDDYLQIASDHSGRGIIDTRRYQLPKIQTFWERGPMTGLEYGCIWSWRNMGHEVDVYTYDPDFELDIPDVTVKDASEILDEEEIFYYGSGFNEGSVSGFANLFRYQLIYDKGGVWADTDIMFVEPIDIDGYPFLIYDCHMESPIFEAEGHFVANSLFAAQSGSPLMKYCLDYFSTANVKELQHGESGPRLFTRAVTELKLSELVNEAKPYFPIHWVELDKLFEERICISERVKSIHFWNSQLQERGIDKDVIFTEDFFRKLSVVNRGKKWVHQR